MDNLLDVLFRHQKRSHIMPSYDGLYSVGFYKSNHLIFKPKKSKIYGPNKHMT